jgi:hypothetical protein
MNEKDLLNEHSGTQSRTDEFMHQNTKFWRGSRRRAIQLLATGAGATATMSLFAFRPGSTAIAAEVEAKGINKQANQQLEPNVFTLQGDKTQITYSTTSIRGVPELSYLRRGQQRTFSGSDIQSEETAFGRSVTVLLENGAADGPIESLTLLIPFVQLSSKVRELRIQTVAIFSRRVAFINPSNPAQLQTYDTIRLSGTAQFVQF